MTLDEVVYVNIFLSAITKEGDTVTAYYTDAAEDYLRSSLFQTDDGSGNLVDITVTYYEMVDGVPVLHEDVPLLVAVYGEDASLDWGDSTADYNLDDLYQAAEDTRAVIEFIHNNIIVENPA